MINHKDTNLKERNAHVASLTGLTQLQILILIAKEYELLNMIPKAKQTFSKLLENNPHDYETWVFCSFVVEGFIYYVFLDQGYYNTTNDI